MCRRRKNPYKGKLNFVGGKIEPGKEGLAAAVSNCYLEVYAGRLNKTVHVSGEENELCWEVTDQDFFNTHLFAGEGNIGHILMHMESNTVLR